MSRYKPNPLPQTLPAALRAWLADELRNIAAALAAPDVTTLRLQPRTAEPQKLENGIMVYADGTLWDPGAGEGFYGYEAGAWVKL